MTFSFLHLLPAALCLLAGFVCANEAAFNLRLGENTQAVRNGLASFVCWAGAAVSLMGALG